MKKVRTADVPAEIRNRAHPEYKSRAVSAAVTCSISKGSVRNRKDKNQGDEENRADVQQ
jgi:hypothetical protein